MHGGDGGAKGDVGGSWLGAGGACGGAPAPAASSARASTAASRTSSEAAASPRKTCRTIGLDDMVSNPDKMHMGIARGQLEAPGSDATCSWSFGLANQPYSAHACPLQHGCRSCLHYHRPRRHPTYCSYVSHDGRALCGGECRPTIDDVSSSSIHLRTLLLRAVPESLRSQNRDLHSVANNCDTLSAGVLHRAI